MLNALEMLIVQYRLISSSINSNVVYYQLAVVYLYKKWVAEFYENKMLSK